MTNPAERLVDLLWPGRPPENPSSALHSAVFKLRVSLAEVSGRDLLVTRDRGYRLAVTVDDVDALLFTELAQRAAREPGDEAVATLAAALELWNGRAYGSHADTQVAQLDALRLEELRCTAVERYAGALGQLGQARSESLDLIRFQGGHGAGAVAVDLLRGLVVEFDHVPLVELDAAVGVVMGAAVQAHGCLAFSSARRLRMPARAAGPKT